MSKATPPRAATSSQSGPSIPSHRYTARLADTIETRWQRWWAEHDTFRTPNPSDPPFDPPFGPLAAKPCAGAGGFAMSLQPGPQPGP